MSTTKLGAVIGIVCVVVVLLVWSLFGGGGINRTHVVGALDGTIEDPDMVSVVKTTAFAMVNATDGFDYRAGGLSVEVYVYDDAETAQAKAKGLPGRAYKFVHKNLVVFVHRGNSKTVEAAIKGL